MCLENSHKYFLNFYVLGAFNIMYKHQDFFYDCHFLYIFLFFHQPHHFFRILFTTQHGVFHNVNFSSPASQFLSPFLHDKSHKRVFETLTVSGRRQKRGKQGQEIKLCDSICLSSAKCRLLLLSFLLFESVIEL